MESKIEGEELETEAGGSVEDTEIKQTESVQGTAKPQTEVAVDEGDDEEGCTGSMQETANPETETVVNERFRGTACP